ncbi:ATPase, partial [Rhizobium jaguaris]
SIIMDRLLDRAHQEQEWGVPAILEACLAVAKADPQQGLRLAAFLNDRPPAQITPGIVPKIGDQPWADGVFEKWKRTGVPLVVKRAIEKAEQ